MAQWFGAFLGMPFRERLDVVLHELGSKFGVRDKRGILLMPELSHADLADMIGSSRPMVSRLIAEMTEEGLLIRQGKQFILLAALAEEESDSLSQRKELSGSKGSPESSRMPKVRRPLFKHSLTAGNDRLRIGPVLSASAAKRSPKGLRI